MTTEERSTLALLDRILQSDEVRSGIDSIAEGVARELAQDETALMKWEPVPLSFYRESLPHFIRSSWVFILRAGAITGAERHPNSHQRMMSFRGAGNMQVGGEGAWESHFLTSARSEDLDGRWISIPTNVWHQPNVGDTDWVVVSFHTVPAEELIEERQDSATPGHTIRRAYVAT